MVIVYLRDGTGYGALDYWLTNGMLHIETTYGSEKLFPMDQVDIQRTVSENATRGTYFTVYASPLASDPGRLFAPDSYAPPCAFASAPPSTTRTSQPSAATTGEASWFGVGGSPSAAGLAVSSVRLDSPAALIGVQPGDVVVRINCQAVRSTQDIESSVNAPGTVWVSYMIRGAWLTDKKIVR